MLRATSTLYFFVRVPPRVFISAQWNAVGAKVFGLYLTNCNSVNSLLTSYDIVRFPVQG